MFPQTEPTTWFTPPRIAGTVAGALGVGALLSLIVWNSFAPSSTVQTTQVQGMVVDISDPIEPELRQHLTGIALADVEQLRYGDALTLAQLTADTASPITPIFEIDPVPERGTECRFNIGCNRADNEKRFKAKVVEPFTRAVQQRAFLPGHRPRTPLLQGLHALTTKRSAWRGDDPSAIRTLRVITDGLVHTGRCSVYAIAKRAPAEPKRKGPAPDRLAADPGCQAEMREFPGNFRNTDVELIFVQRPKAQGGDLQTHDLVEWLERYFLSGGARQVRVRRVG
jgi:hypothetical protein